MNARQEQLQEWLKSKEAKSKQVTTVSDKENRVVTKNNSTNTQPKQLKSRPSLSLPSSSSSAPQARRASTLLPRSSSSSEASACTVRPSPFQSSSRSSLQPSSRTPLQRSSSQPPSVPSSLRTTTSQTFPYSTTHAKHSVRASKETKESTQITESNVPQDKIITKINETTEAHKSNTYADLPTILSPNIIRPIQEDKCTQTENIDIKEITTQTDEIAQEVNALDELSLLRSQLADAKRHEEAYVFSHEVLIQEIGDQRGKFNRLLQEEYQKHANEIASLKAAQAEFEALVSANIDSFRASTVSVLKSHVDKINMLELENTLLKNENAELLSNVLPGDVYNNEPI